VPAERPQSNPAVAAAGAVPPCAEVAAPAANAIEAAACVTGSSEPGWTREQQELWVTQKHPDATRNIVLTMPRACCCSVVLRIFLYLLVVVLALPLVLFLLVPLLFSAAVSCLSWDCMLRAWGLGARSNHEPKFMMTCETEVPERLRGVFYMRNNPMGDDLVCFQRGAWDEATLSLTLPVYTPLTWTFKRQLVNFILLMAVQLVQYRYVLQFKDSTLTDADIRLKILCFTMPTCLMHFGMADVSESLDGSLWERWSSICGIPVISYWVERILCKNGWHTEYMQHVKKEVPDKCIVVGG